MSPPVAPRPSDTTIESSWNAARLDWTTLLRHVHDIDALACPCGGRLRFVQLVTTLEEARPLLDVRGLPTRAPAPRERPPSDPRDFYDPEPPDEHHEPETARPRIRPPPEPDEHLFVDEAPPDD